MESLIEKSRDQLKNFAAKNIVAHSIPSHRRRLPQSPQSKPRETRGVQIMAGDTQVTGKRQARSFSVLMSVE